LAFGLLLAIAMAVIGNTWVSRTGQAPLAPVHYWITQCQVILHYLYIAIWPIKLTIDYGWPAATLREAWLAVTVIMTLMGLSAWALWRQRVAGFLGTCFFLLLAPTSLIPLPDLAFEHRMYLPLAALILIAAMVMLYLAERVKGLEPSAIPLDVSCRKVATIVVVCLALILGLLTFERNRDYRSAMAIWLDTIQKRPANFRGYHGVGLALSREGRFAEALDYLRQAVQLNPENAYVHNDAGYILFLMNKPGESIPFFREAIRLKPLNPRAHNNLGAALAQTNRLEEAIFQFSVSLKLKPEDNPARNNLIQAAAERKRQSDRIR
jgi:tetratricopeptide (TPR) repeat protein